MSRIAIPAALIEFDDGGNTIWIQGPEGATILRIKCTGRIAVEKCDTSPVSHADMMVEGDVSICCSDDAECG